jgi:hypothetical protein
MTWNSVGDAETDRERRQGSSRRYIDVAEREGEDHRHLERREEAEAEAVPGDDLPAPYRRREKTLEGASDPFAQEAHAGQDEHEEETEEADQGGRERVQEVAVRTAVDVLAIDCR